MQQHRRRGARHLKSIPHGSADSMYVHFPISVHVGGTMKRGALDDLGDHGVTSSLLRGLHDTQPEALKHWKISIPAEAEN